MDRQDVHINEEYEAEDTLAVRLNKLKVEGAPRTGPIREVLEKQARTIVKDVNYLDGELALIEVDGGKNAVQIRTKKPISCSTLSRRARRRARPSVSSLVSIRPSLAGGRTFLMHKKNNLLRYR